MSVILALLQIVALLVALSGFAAVPALGVLTALVMVMAARPVLVGGLSPLMAADCCGLLVALGVAIGGAWRLRQCTEVPGRRRVGVAFGLAFLLTVGAGLSFPGGDGLSSWQDVVQAAGLPSSAGAGLPAGVRRDELGVALAMVAVGVMSLALASGPIRQMAGLLTACEGMLLMAVAEGAVIAICGVAAVVLVLSEAGLHFVRRLSLRQVEGGRLESPG